MGSSIACRPHVPEFVLNLLPRKGAGETPNDLKNELCAQSRKMFCAFTKEVALNRFHHN